MTLLQIIRRRTVSVSCWLIMCFVLSGCTNLGPRAIEAGRTDYNTVLRSTSDQQLLHNLVRLRYMERPFFLEVASVTSQFTFGSSIGAGVTLNVDGLNDETNVGAQGLYQEAPTVAYEPLQGPELVQRLLTPLELESLVMLAQSGWSLERIMRLCVQRANGVGNAIIASGPTPELEPEFRDFLALAQAARTLQLRDELTIAVRAGDTAGLALVVTEQGQASAEFGALTQLLGLSKEHTDFALAEGLWRQDTTSIDVQTRAVNGILYYMSHGVDVPEAHVRAGIVRTTRDKSGAPFDWKQLTGDLFQIRSGKEAPDNADVMIRHRDHWFWIADNDLESKATFSLLSQILALQASSSAKVRPVLTLPVGN